MANARARELRKNMTPQEVRLWVRLRELRRLGFHFRRQVPRDGFILDFACLRARVLIEVDGGQLSFATARKRDFRRDRHFADNGFLVLRFWNHDIDRNLDGVMETIFRMLCDRAPTPATPAFAGAAEQAVRLRRALFLVVDAGRAPSGDWASTLEGPSGGDLIMAAADTAIDTSVRASYAAFESANSQWQTQLVRWRCGLSAAERKRLGASPNWNCRDLRFHIGRLGFDQLGEAREKELDAVPTRFQLPPEQVDLVVGAGREALKDNRVFRAFMAGL